MSNSPIAKRPWLETYPAGVPSDIQLDIYPTVLDALQESFEKYRDRPAFANMGIALTYRQVDEYSSHFAAFLRKSGLQPGDRIALMMPNLLQYPIALYGALKAGLIVVNTNPLYTPREMKHQFNDADAKAIVIAANFAANLQKILPETSIQTVIVTELGDMLGFFKGTLVNFILKNVRKMVPPYQLPQAIGFNPALAQGRKSPTIRHRGNPDDTILIQYTGGTTGVSKGAELTNRNLVANMQQVDAYLFQFLQGNQNALSPLPMYHIFAFTVHALALVKLGAQNILVTNPRDLASVIKEFNSPHTPITLMTGVNTLFNGLINHPDFPKANFAKLQFSVGGGMAVQRPVAEKWAQLTGKPLLEGYGLTETSPVLSVNHIVNNQLGTIGLPLPATEMRVVNDNGTPLAQGEVGEIQARGPQVMKGYFNRPEATREVMKDGWFATGDIGLMLPNGFFKIVDRKKDMILVSGFNVYPNEVEEVLVAHPKIREAAAIGIPDTKTGEAVKVFVVPTDNSITEQDIKLFCKENLTPYKCPKYVEFRSELPKSNVGKILRKELRPAK